jgi:hypothetical protein
MDGFRPTFGYNGGSYGFGSVFAFIRSKSAVEILFA